MPAGLRLVEMTDRDVLYALADVANEEGWASSTEIAAHIGITAKYPARNVGSRFASLRRFGLLERKVEKGETFWRANDDCHALVFANGHITAAQQRMIENLPEGKRAEAIRALAALLPEGSRASIHLGRRAWQGTFTWRDKKLMPKARK
jgi:hypothetical protein